MIFDVLSKYQLSVETIIVFVICFQIEAVHYLDHYTELKWTVSVKIKMKI